MSITAFFRTLSSRSHWAIHSVWLVVLAGLLCANVVDGYFSAQESELRLLLSESSIAVNIVKMEVGGITHLLDTVEVAAIAPRNEDQLADRLQNLVRENPFVSAIAVELDGVPHASVGAVSSAPSAVFSRSTARDGFPTRFCTHSPETRILGIQTGVCVRPRRCQSWRLHSLWQPFAAPLLPTWTAPKMQF